MTDIFQHTEGLSSRDKLDNFFRISERNSTVGTEIRAGLSSFLTLSYLLLVNPQVMGAAGIPQADVVTATCISCAVPTLIVGIFGNLPFVMAPGLGLSAYFTYGLVLTAPGMTWQQALACVFIAGAIMLFLSATFLVERAMTLVPGYIKLSTIIGIGLLLACIGLEQAGLIYHGRLGDLFGPMAWVKWATLGGLLLIGALTHNGTKGAILIGVLSVSLVFWGGTGTWPARLVEMPTLKDSFLQLDFAGLDARAVPSPSQPPSRATPVAPSQPHPPPAAHPSHSHLHPSLPPSTPYYPDTPRPSPPRTNQTRPSATGPRRAHLPARRALRLLGVPHRALHEGRAHPRGRRRRRPRRRLGAHRLRHRHHDRGSDRLLAHHHRRRVHRRDP